MRWWQGRKKGASDAAAPPAADSGLSEIDSTPAVAAGPDPEFARLLGELGDRMAAAGLLGNAVESCQIAVEESRRLAAVDPPRYTPELARHLHALAGLWCHADRFADAAEAAAEAVALYRAVQGLDPAGHRAGLAGALNRLGFVQHLDGATAQAIPPLGEAVRLYRAGAGASGIVVPDPAYAEALWNYGVLLWETGQADEALEARIEVLEIYRALLAADPDYRSMYLLAADGLATSLEDRGRTAEAAAVRREAATTTPPEPNDDHTRRNALFAMLDAMLLLAQHLAGADRADEAADLARQAVSVFRQMRAADPDASWAGLPAVSALAGMSATPTALELLGSGAVADALVAAGQEVDRYRRLAAEDPASHRPALAIALNNVGNMLIEMHRYDEAVEQTEEAVELFRVLAVDRPAQYRPALAMSSANLARALVSAGRYGEALAPADQSLACFAELAAESPAQYAADVDEAREQVARLAALAPDAGVAAVEEAVARYRDLATTDPATHQERYATALLDLATQVVSTDPQRASQAAEEAIALYLGLAAPHLDRLEIQLARAVHLHSVALHRAGRYPAALAAASEALTRYRRLEAAHPGGFNGAIELVQHNHTIITELCTRIA